MKITIPLDLKCSVVEGKLLPEVGYYIILSYENRYKYSVTGSSFLCTGGENSEEVSLIVTNDDHSEMYDISLEAENDEEQKILNNFSSLTGRDKEQETVLLSIIDYED